MTKDETAKRLGKVFGTILQEATYRLHGGSLKGGLDLTMVALMVEKELARLKKTELDGIHRACADLLAE